MIVTYEDLCAFAACHEGLEDFLREFPSGGDISDIIATARRLDQEKGDEIQREAFVRYLRLNIPLLESKGLLQMSSKFHVFNPQTGAHEQCSTLEEALAIRSRIFQEFINLHQVSFTISQEAVNTETGDSLWVKVPIPPNQN